MFNHIPIKTPLIETAHYDGKHFYSIDGKTFPSITTILHSFPNEGINQWKLRTPNWEEIQQESFSVGTELHGKIESYLKNVDHDKDITLLPMKLFYNLKPELDKINNIQAQETRLYHKDLSRLQGRLTVWQNMMVRSVLLISRTPASQKRNGWSKSQDITSN